MDSEEIDSNTYLSGCARLSFSRQRPNCLEENGFRNEECALTSTKLRVAMNVFPDLLLLIDIQGGCRVISGPESQCTVIKELSSLFPEPTVTEIKKYTLQAIRQETPVSFSYRLSSPGKVAAWFEARIVKSSEAEALAVIRDITEVVREREILKANSEFYEDIINSVNVDIAVLDNENRYRLLSKTAIRNSEVREWLIGKTDYDYSKLKGKDNTIAESRTRMYRLVDELGQPVDWIEELSDEKGNKRFFARTLKPFEDGKFKVGYGMDITALKVVQDELQRREHLLSFSHQLVKTGYWVYYPRTNKHEWSDGVYNILEIDKDSLSPSLDAYYGFIHPEDRAGVKKYIKSLSGSNNSGSLEFRIITPSGNIKYLKEQSSSKISDTEEYIFGVIQDITEVKQNLRERELLIQEINDKYKDLMQFNYIISHNLRSPVANILGMSSLLSMDLPKEELTLIYDYISQSANCIDTVIKDLNNILSTRSVLNEKKETFLLKEILDSISYNLQTQIAESKTRLIVDIDDEAAELKSIKSYIHSIFYNLISNAIKYRAEDRAPEIRIKVRKDKETYFIEVADNGMGIDLTQHGNHIFGLYKRFTSHKEGRGLGLHMTRTQVESLGGNISVESQPGVGTTFKIVLKA